MAGRKIKDAADARACLTAVEASGMTRAQWARGVGIDARSLNLWRVNLERWSEPAPPKPPLQMVELVAASADQERTTAYTIRCGRLAVEVGDDFDEDTLFRLLQVVAAC